MENNLKVIKAEYLSNHWSELPQILNLSLRGPNKKMIEMKMTPMEDDLKILNLDYLSNHWIDLHHNVNLNSGTQIKQ